MASVNLMALVGPSFQIKLLRSRDCLKQRLQFFSLLFPPPAVCAFVVSSSQKAKKLHAGTLQPSRLLTSQMIFNLSEACTHKH